MIPAEDHDSTPIRDVIRLSSNENPYAPSDAMKTVMANIGNRICRYPNRDFSTLEKKIAEIENVPPECVVVTSGSREGLKAVGLIKSLEGGEIACCLPTYRALLSYAEHWGAMLRVSPLKDNLDYNLPAMYDSLNEKTKMAFICNPNNPTGTLLPADEVERYTRMIAEKATAFVDEVYFDYIEQSGYPSMKKLILEGMDVIVSRTLSKVYGLAGVRIGYMMATPETADKIRKSLMSGTNTFGIALGTAALDDPDFKAFSLAKNKECKEMIYSALDKLGIRYLRSHTNFVFFHADRPITEVQDSFLGHGVQVGRAFPPYMDWCRISTGTTDEVQHFVDALPRVFG